MLLSLYIAKIGTSNLRVVVRTGDHMVASFEAASISASFRRVAELPMAGLKGFEVWYAGTYAGRVECSEVATDAEAAADRVFSFVRTRIGP